MAVFKPDRIKLKDETFESLIIIQNVIAILYKPLYLNLIVYMNLWLLKWVSNIWKTQINDKGDALLFAYNGNEMHYLKKVMVIYWSNS